MVIDTTLQHGPSAKAKGNLDIHRMAPLRERMWLIIREANSNLNIQNLGKETSVGKRHFGLLKDLVLIVGKVKEIWEGVPL